MFARISFEQHDLTPEGTIALLRDRQVVWIGSLGSPIEDAEFDSILMQPADIGRLKDDVLKFNEERISSAPCSGPTHEAAR